MLTKEQIAKRLAKYDADEQDVADALAIQTAGYQHGTLGVHPPTERTTEHSDWWTEVGVEIEALEDAYGMPEGTLRRIYDAAWRVGRKQAKANAADRAIIEEVFATLLPCDRLLSDEAQTTKKPIVGTVAAADLSNNLSPRHHAKRGTLKPLKATGGCTATCGEGCCAGATA